MKQEIIEELKTEEKKYRSLYEKNKNILDCLKADCFKLAITKSEKQDIKEIYIFFKTKRDELAKSYNRLGTNLYQGYNLVVGKLWKHYKNVK